MYTYETRTLFYAIYDIVFFFFYKESLSTCQRDAFPFSALPCTVEKFILEWIINLLADSSIFPPLRRCIQKILPQAHARHYLLFVYSLSFYLSFLFLFVSECVARIIPTFVVNC